MVVYKPKLQKYKRGRNEYWKV